jgi:glycerate-2-kinase
MKKISLLELWKQECHSVDPVFLFSKLPKRAREVGFGADAFVFIGKVSERFFEAVQDLCRGKPVLGIAPDSARIVRRSGHWIAAEHPIPGPGSFEAGHALLEFFDGLRRLGSRRLTIFLSGGASSLIWLAPRNSKTGRRLTHSEIVQKLETLYRQGLDIHELNRQRSKLCQLKAGGAAEWLHRLAPKTQAKVCMLSDVEPFGPEVVGSGPFWDGKTPHRVLASNTTLVQALRRGARARGIRVLHSSSGMLGSSEGWLKEIVKRLEPALCKNQKGLFIFGGEPSVRLSRPKALGAKGGRQTHLALLLAESLRPWILDGRLEILAMSTDGQDGRSGSAGAWLEAEKFASFLKKTTPSRIRQALRNYDSARLLGALHALVSQNKDAPRSNVQDILMIRVL